MRRFLWAPLAALGLGMMLTTPAAAQIGGYQRPKVNPYPTVNPYLNIARGGNPAINYYGIVRPQMDTSQAITKLQQTTTALEKAEIAPGDVTPTLGVTGHGASFFNYSHYFTPPGGRPGGGGAGTLGQPTGYGGGRR